MTADSKRLGKRHGDPINHDNDNGVPNIFLVGAGNLEWDALPWADLSADEVTTLSAPLVELHSWIDEATRALRGEARGGYYCAIYVISDIYGRETKIGRAQAPTKRLAQLQTGNPRRLFVHRAFWIWCETSEDADYVERAAHGRAGAMFGRLEGEWFKCSPTEAHGVIEGVLTDAYGQRRFGQYCEMTPSRKIWGRAA